MQSYGDFPMWSSTTYTTTAKLVSLGNLMVNPAAVEAVDTDRNNSKQVKLLLRRGTPLTAAVPLEEALTRLEDAGLIRVGEGAVQFSAIEAITPSANSKRECRVHMAGGGVLELSMSVNEMVSTLQAGLEAKKSS